MTTFLLVAVIILAIALISACCWGYKLKRKIKVLRWMIKKLEGMPARHPYDSAKKGHTGDSTGR